MGRFEGIQPPVRATVRLHRPSTDWPPEKDVHEHHRRTEFRVDRTARPLSHYTDAVRWGDLVFVSGCAAIDERGPGRRVPGDVAGQAELVHEYLGRALRAAGTDFAHVLKVTVFLTRT